MRLAQSRFWRASLNADAATVGIELQKGGPPGIVAEMTPLAIEVPLAKWNLIVKYARTDRRMLGGLLLEFARHKERVSAAVASDVLFVELQGTVLDATAALVEEGFLLLTTAKEIEQ
jgi:hypothetical protein